MEFKEKSWSEEFNKRFLKGIQCSGGYTYIGWNNDHPIFKESGPPGDDAFNRSSEYGRKLTVWFGGNGRGPISKFRPEYNHDLTPYGYDYERALDLLDAAGWVDVDDDGILDKEIDGEKVDFNFELLINSGNQIRKDIALTLQSELADIGIECQVRDSIGHLSAAGQEQRF